MFMRTVPGQEHGGDPWPCPMIAIDEIDWTSARIRNALEANLRKQTDGGSPGDRNA